MALENINTGSSDNPGIDLWHREQMEELFGKKLVVSIVAGNIGNELFNIV
jgi:hypothetical protein